MIFIAIYGNFAIISSFSRNFGFNRFFPSDMGPFICSVNVALGTGTGSLEEK